MWRERERERERDCNSIFSVKSPFGSLSFVSEKVFHSISISRPLLSFHPAPHHYSLHSKSHICLWILTTFFHRKNYVKIYKILLQIQHMTKGFSSPFFLTYLIFSPFIPFSFFLSPSHHHLSFSPSPLSFSRESDLFSFGILWFFGRSLSHHNVQVCECVCVCTVCAWCVYICVGVCVCVCMRVYGMFMICIVCARVSQSSFVREWCVCVFECVYLSRLCEWVCESVCLKFNFESRASLREWNSLKITKVFKLKMDSLLQQVCVCEIELCECDYLRFFEMN